MNEQSQVTLGAFVLHQRQPKSRALVPKLLFQEDWGLSDIGPQLEALGDQWSGRFSETATISGEWTFPFPSHQI